MRDEIIYRQMTLTDREEALAFLRVAFADTPRQSDLEFWNWHYLDNPNNRDDEIPIWLGKSGDRIVGQLATLPVELNLAGEAVAAVWLLDLMVDPGFRRRGIMKNLVLEAQKTYAYMLGSATRKQHSAAMLTGLGWKVFSTIPRYHLMLFPGNAVRDVAQIRPLRGLVNALFSPFRPRVAKPETRGMNVRQLDEFDERFDELWGECRSQWGCSISRNLEYLQWQFGKQPKKEYEILGCFKGDKIVGYAVMFFREASRAGVIEKAAISDICYHADNGRGVVDALLQAAITRAVDRRAGGLVTDAIDPLLDERLRHFGFWPVNSGLEIMAIGPAHEDVLYDWAKWHLTRGDSDISIFEHPNV